MLLFDFFPETGHQLVNDLQFFVKWSHDLTRDLLTQYLHFKMLRTMSSSCERNFDSAPSSMPKFWPINHFAQTS